MRKLLFRLCLSVAFLGLVFSSAEASQKKVLTAGILSGEWQIVEMQGTGMPESENLFSLNLDCMKKSVAGFTGCNYLNGKFEFKARKNRLKFQNLASTRMACPLSETENELIRLLNTACTYSFEQEKNRKTVLSLKDAEGNILLVLNKMMPLDGRWTVSRIQEEPVRTENEIYLIFNSSQSTIYGKIGCNSYSSSLQTEPQKPSVIHIGQGITTMMACPDMETEKAMLKALQEVCSYKKFSERKAILCDTAGNVVLELTR